MSVPQHVEAAVAPNGRPKRVFRTAANGPRLSVDEARRESRAIRLALDGLGVDRAGAFLNGFDASLDGRPLAIAAHSEDGAIAVERRIEILRESVCVMMKEDTMTAAAIVRPPRLLSLIEQRYENAGRGRA